jgi:hypothetical protein
MTDGANAFWNAYEKHFETTGTVRQLCIWHIWHNWLAKLKLILSLEHRQRARAALRILAK